MFSVKFKVKEGRNSLPRSSISARSNQQRRTSHGSVSSLKSAPGTATAPANATDKSGTLKSNKKVRIITGGKNESPTPSRKKNGNFICVCVCKAPEKYITFV